MPKASLSTLQPLFKTGEPALMQELNGTKNFLAPLTKKLENGSLERVFANGNRVVITDLGNGQTSRQVFNNGRLIIDDLKTISTDLLRSGKTVKTKHVDRIKTRIKTNLYNSSFQYNNTTQRLYSENGEFLGMKQTEIRPYSVNAVEGNRLRFDIDVTFKNAEPALPISPFCGNRPKEYWETVTIPSKEYECSGSPAAEGHRRQFKLVDGKYICTFKEPMALNWHRTAGEGIERPVFHDTYWKDFYYFGRFTTGNLFSSGLDCNKMGLPIPYGLLDRSKRVYKSDMKYLDERFKKIAVKNSSGRYTIPIDHLSLKDMEELSKTLRRIHSFGFEPKRNPIEQFFVNLGMRFRTLLYNSLWY